MAALSYFYKHWTPYSADRNIIRRRFSTCDENIRDASGCSVFALSVPTIVYFDLQVWIARLEEEKKKKSRPTLPTTFIMRLLDTLQLPSRKSKRRRASWRQWKLLLAQQEKRNDICAAKMRFFGFNFCMTWIETKAKRRRRAAREERWKKNLAGNVHRVANIPEAAVRKYFIQDYTPLSARSHSDSKPSGSPAVHFWVLQARNCSKSKYWTDFFSTHFSGFCYWFFLQHDKILNMFIFSMDHLRSDCGVVNIVYWGWLKPHTKRRSTAILSSAKLCSDTN